MLHAFAKMLVMTEFIKRIDLIAGYLISFLFAPLNLRQKFLEASIRLNTTPVSTGVVILFLFLLHCSNAQPLPTVQLPVFKKANFLITNYGAKADGISLNTKSINSAIDDCNRKGGGNVIIPAGFWLTGPIV